MKYNLGCGPDNRDGYINVDLSGQCDIIADLNTIEGFAKLPTGATEVIANDILEHVDSPLSFINCCWDILVPGGKLHIRTPDADSPFLWIDPTHKRGFKPETFHFFDPETDYGKYNIHLTDKKWKILSNEIVNHNVCVTMEKL